MDAKLRDNVFVSGSYAYGWNSNGNEHGLGANLTVTW